MRVLPRGLRVRSAMGFAVLALALSTVLSTATYQLARLYLLDQRQTLASRQAVLHAQVVAGLLSGQGEPTDDEILDALAQTRGRAVLRVGDSWYAAVVDLNESRIPSTLIERTATGVAQRQRVRVNGVPYFLVGVPVPVVDAAFFEFVPAVEYENTLRTLGLVLALTASVTTAIGALTGFGVSRRVVRPLHDVAATARAMSAGDLHQRLDVQDDPDLLPMAESFNQMAASLEERIAREQRFTADVSHELRTPLTSMGSAIALAQRSTTPDRVSFAIDVLADQVEHLRQLTLELLELSRIDAGRQEADRELVDVAELTARQAELHGAGAALAPRAEMPVVHEVNPIRFERVVGNLLENAARYAGGATRVECRHDGTSLRVEVEDHGPGIPAAERQSIFERFHRGSTTALPGHPKGTGLGLALVHEYVRLEGGRVWVEEAQGGGSCFVVEIP